MPSVGSGNGVATIRIHRESLEGVNSLEQITNINSLYVEHSNGFYTYNIKKILVDPVDSDAFYITIKQEHNTPPTSSASTPVVFTPYIAGKFKNGDFDALLSNALRGEDSTKFTVVDNNSSQLTPTNLTAINNRSAGKAQVVDSNYEVGSYKNIRYDGSTHTATAFNVSSTSTGLKPIEQTSAYFAYFNWIGGTSPDLQRKTGASIKYLIDLEGNVQSPRGNDSSVSEIMKQNFAQGSEVVITLDNPDYGGVNMQGLNGTATVHKGGQRIENIISTLSGSYAYAVTGSKLWFERPDGTSAFVAASPPNGEFTQAVSNTNSISGSFTNAIITGGYRFIGFSGDGITETETAPGTNSSYLPAEEGGYLAPSLEFTITRGDVITFLHKGTNNYKEFTVLNVDSASAATQIKLELDQNIVLSDYEARGYSIKRYEDAAGSILLNKDKPAGGTSGGIIQPRFMPPGSDEKLQVIIDDLKQKGII